VRASKGIIMNNSRIYELAEQALAISNNDPVCAVQILQEWTGLSFEMAFEAIDAVCPPDFDDRDYFAAEKPFEEPL
jgi:hypothetical protein